MQDTVTRFLRHLEVERDASPLTVKSYREDLAALTEYLAEARQHSPLLPDISTLDLRAYVSAVNAAG